MLVATGPRTLNRVGSPASAATARRRPPLSSAPPARRVPCTAPPLHHSQAASKALQQQGLSTGLIPTSCWTCLTAYLASSRRATAPQCQPPASRRALLLPPPVLSQAPAAAASLLARAAAAAMSRRLHKAAACGGSRRGSLQPWYAGAVFVPAIYICPGSNAQSNQLPPPPTATQQHAALLLWTRPGRAAMAVLQAAYTVVSRLLGVAADVTAIAADLGECHLFRPGYCSCTGAAVWLFA